MPKLTFEYLTGLVTSIQYHLFPGTRLTVCCLTLKNGFSVVGFSACVDQSDFDEEIGRDIAYKDAVNKIWEVEGYLARQRLYEGRETEPVPSE